MPHVYYYAGWIWQQVIVQNHNHQMLVTTGYKYDKMNAVAQVEYWTQQRGPIFKSVLPCKTLAKFFSLDIAPVHSAVLVINWR